MLGDVVTGPVELEVVAYRPTERAVVRTTDANGRVRYVKITAPDTTAALVDRHVRLGAAGVPVPAVLAADTELGWLAMAELAGPTLRERLRAGTPPWPRPDTFVDAIARIRSVELTDAAPRRPRCLDAGGHARMLASVMPSERHRLGELIDRFEPLAEQALARSGPTVHGDLHEGQLVVDGERIIGVLDIDDLGPGDPIDDMATVLGHLRYRAGTAGDGSGAAIHAYADDLWRGFASSTDPSVLDAVTAAVLVGLATGPFRIQQLDWPTVVGGQLDLAERLLDSAGAGPNGEHR
jgi:aminoglycoside phosphotransferase (APT) family kinase protein